MINEQLQKLYHSYIGDWAQKIEELPSSGSNRRYFRLYGQQTLIGVCGTSVRENEAFIYMSEFFRSLHLNVPEVYMVSENRQYYIQEDLGDTLLFNAIEKGRLTRLFSEEEKQLLRTTVRQLVDFQFAGTKLFDFSKCYPQAELDRRSILWDLNYFKYCFLKATGIDFEEDKLEDDFNRFADFLLTDNTNSTFMYRDFQSRNVMIKDGTPYFIDFQGGRKGPFYYDIASFLWQSKANFTPNLRKELLEEYLLACQKYQYVDKEEFYNKLHHFVLFRLLQVLGAYGFRGYFEKKPHFIESVPFAINNLRELLEHDFSAYPYLCDLLNRLVCLKQFTLDAIKKPLTVKVISFAYKKGIPYDVTGNGGGYVFDCRAINNPGKYERYKPFTGRDNCVIEFLENDGEIFSFLDHAYALVDASVERYIERNFTHLSVYFGCTGGQHRSVYSAEHLAHHLHEKYKIKVELVHREQNIEQTLKI